MNDIRSSETVSFRAKQPLWYRTERGRFEAEFVKLSASGKRAYIRFDGNELQGGWMRSSFVDIKNIEPRNED
jgi:hypothetical protein